MEKSLVTLYTDGSCIGNRGGWAFILIDNKTGKELSSSGSLVNGQSNNMELLAVKEALMRLKKPCHITLLSNNSYIINGITKWMFKWEKLGWYRTKNSKKPIMFVDIWKSIWNLLEQHDIQCEYIKDFSEFSTKCKKLAQNYNKVLQRK
jgi:ribonuclease HI